MGKYCRLVLRRARARCKVFSSLAIGAQFVQYVGYRSSAASIESTLACFATQGQLSKISMSFLHVRFARTGSAKRAGNNKTRDFTGTHAVVKNASEGVSALVIIKSFSKAVQRNLFKFVQSCPFLIVPRVS